MSSTVTLTHVSKVQTCPYVYKKQAITYLVWHVFLQMQVCIRKLPVRLGVCQAQRLEHSASDIHKIVTALARPRITPHTSVRLWCGFGTWRHRFVMPSIRHMGANATRVALMLRVQSVKALTIFWPQYCLYFCHLPFFCTLACVAISNTGYTTSNGRMIQMW
jgi:hypothetical protein